MVHQTTSYRIRVGASQVEAATTSGVTRILARRLVSLAGAPTTHASTAKLGTALRLQAVVGPTTPSVKVTLKIARYDTASRTWKPSATLTATTSGGKATFNWRPTSRAAYRLQFSTPPTAQFANGVSPLYVWTIS
jgi:hypothetical protein